MKEEVMFTLHLLMRQRQFDRVNHFQLYQTLIKTMRAYQFS